MGNIGDKYGQVYLAKSFIISCLCLNQYWNYQLFWMRAIIFDRSTVLLSNLFFLEKTLSSVSRTKASVSSRDLILPVVSITAYGTPDSGLDIKYGCSSLIEILPSFKVISGIWSRIRGASFFTKLLKPICSDHRRNPAYRKQHQKIKKIQTFPVPCDIDIQLFRKKRQNKNMKNRIPLQITTHNNYS